jgi:hypothetical protein
MKTDSELEIIGDYKVHPAASLFPSIEGEDFEKLVASVSIFGLIHPIIVKGPYLIDGRNRLRAVIEANKQGRAVELKTTELEGDIESPAEYIYQTNVNRRSLTKDQMVSIGGAVLVMVAEEKKAKGKATQFKAGVSNPRGKSKAQVDLISDPPETTGESTVNTKPCSPSIRDNKKMHEQSTVGTIAKLAGVSNHKARQLVAVTKAVESGALPSDTVDKVKSGALKLKDIAPKPKPRPKPKPADDPAPDKEKDDAFEDITKSIDRYLDLDFTNKKRLREKIETYLDHKGN